MTFFWLYLLATVDSSFCGYRAVAGQNALIFKRNYYLQAMKCGALWGQFAVVIAAVVGGFLYWNSEEKASLFHHYHLAGKALLQIYIPYAVLIGIAFLFRSIPSVDIQSLTSVLVFGPFTLIRPAVAFLGFIWALLQVPQFEIVLMFLVILPMMLGMQRFLEWKGMDHENISSRAS